MGLRCTFGDGGCGIGAGETEVENLDEPVRGDHDVLGLEVAMHNVLVVSGGEAIRELGSVVHGFPKRQRRAFEFGPQGFAVDQFQNRVSGVGLGPEIVDGQNVWMRESRDRLRFTLESG